MVTDTGDVEREELFEDEEVVDDDDGGDELWAVGDEDLCELTALNEKFKSDCEHDMIQSVCEGGLAGENRFWTFNQLVEFWETIERFADVSHRITALVKQSNKL